MAQPTIQNSFSKGELSPSLFARTDLATYKVGLAKMYNFFVDYRGGASNRPGTEFIAESAMPGADFAPKLIPFIYNSDQTYVLEFGNGYMRVFRNGALLESSPGVPYTLGTPYTGAEVATLKYAQSADVITITHPLHASAKITRLGDTNWTFSNEVFGSSLGPPTGVTVSTNGPLPEVIYAYVVTSIDAAGAESIGTAVTPGTAPDLRISTNKDYYVQVAWTPVPGAVEYNIYKADVTSIYPSQGQRVGFIGRAQGASFIETYPSIGPDFSKGPPSNRNPFARGAITGITMLAPGSGYMPQDTAAAAISGTGSGSILYPLINVASGAVIDIVVKVAGEQYVTGEPVGISSVGVGTGAFASLVAGPAFGTFPSSVAYFQQRKVYAGSISSPETLWASRPGTFTSFDVSNPVIDSDSITATLASYQVNAISWMVPMPGGLVVFTSGGVWQVSGGPSNGPITPSNIIAQPQGYSGAANVKPIAINSNILFVQSKGAVVRDLQYNFFTNIYDSEDRSVFSNHLFYGRKIVNWAYAEEPFKLVWAVRDDGRLLSLTYLKEQQVAGWAQHETAGFFEDICVVPEGSEDAVYFVVKRQVQGAPHHYIERLRTRAMPSGLVDAWFVDSALRYIGAPTTVLSGLDHLIGLTVNGVADGAVIAPQVVSGAGTITLPQPCSIATVGLYYSAQLTSLRVDTGEPTIQGKRKTIPAVTIRVQDTRGLRAGPSEDKMDIVKAGDLNGLIQGLGSGDERVLIQSGWDREGQIVVQQTSPWPATVLGWMPELVVGDTR